MVNCLILIKVYLEVFSEHFYYLKIVPFEEWIQKKIREIREIRKSRKSKSD